MTKKEMLREFGRGITILKNKNVAVAFVVRIINQLSLFGLVVFLPHVIRHISASLRQNGYVFGA